MDFDQIFGPGEFDNDENIYKRKFPLVNAGGERNVLEFATVKEHADRHGYETNPDPNGRSKDFEIIRNNLTVEVENFEDFTELTLEFDDDIGDIESYMRKAVDPWLGEIIRREQKVYKASTRFVNQQLPEIAEKKGMSELEALKQQLSFAGDELSDFHSSYRAGNGPHDIAVHYAMEFELWPFEDAEMDRSDLPGKMPIGDEREDEDLRRRNDHYMRKYLKSLIEEADRQYGLDEELKGEWLEYVDLSFY